MSAAPPPPPPSQLPSQLLHTLSEHEGPVLNVRFTPRGNYCISCGKVRAQGGRGGGQRGWVSCILRLSQSSAHPLATHTHTQDRTLRLWNPAKGLPIKAYRGHGYEVRDVSVCTDNSKLASVGGDRQVCVGLAPVPLIGVAARPCCVLCWCRHLNPPPPLLLLLLLLLLSLLLPAGVSVGRCVWCGHSQVQGPRLAHQRGELRC
jgi:hypothetical protein